MNRFMIGVNHPDAHVYIALDETTAKKTARILQARFNAEPEITPQDTGPLNDLTVHVTLDGGGSIIQEWHRSSIPWASQDSNHFVVASFYDHDVDFIIGALKDGIAKAEDGVVLLTVWAYPFSLALEIDHASYLLAEIKKNVKQYQPHKERNLEMREVMDEALGKTGKFVLPNVKTETVDRLDAN